MQLLSQNMIWDPWHQIFVDQIGFSSLRETDLSQQPSYRNTRAVCVMSCYWRSDKSSSRRHRCNNNAILWATVFVPGYGLFTSRKSGDVYHNTVDSSTVLAMCSAALLLAASAVVQTVTQLMMSVSRSGCISCFYPQICGLMIHELARSCKPFGGKNLRFGGRKSLTITSF